MQKQAPGELIFRRQNPDNLEAPREVFDAPLTPLEHLFVRNHFEVPQLDADDWRLEVTGDVVHPREYKLDDLGEFDRRTVRATIECAGNGRARLGEKASGVPWRGRAVGTAQWRGVALRDLLDEAAVGNDVREIICVGADRGTVDTADGGQLRIPYARSLPLEKATSREVLLATEMNGEPLTAEHGYPARLVVPGWYGMAWVKWPVRLVAVTERFDGYFQTEDYATWEKDGDLTVRRPLGQMRVKSHIGAPAHGDTVRPGDTVVIEGFAWGGSAALEAVEVSVDGGESYETAELEETQHPFAWRRFTYQWTVPDDPGPRRLQSRAHTEDGGVQPAEHDWRRGAYAVNIPVPVEVKIDASSHT